MQSKRARLDRFISARLGINRGDVRLMLARGRLWVDGEPVRDAHRLIDQFSRIELDGEVLQSKRPVYVMMHKPVGVLSATRDAHHPIVLDLLERPDRASLHIAGRLDRASSGLLLLTNDGRWSQGLSSPEAQVSKVYQVTLRDPLSPAYCEAFAKGMYFPYESITTRPAQLEILATHVARVTLVEGRYHQIKRMFGRFRNPVLSLHRLAVGACRLDPALAVGESRALTPAEVRGLRQPVGGSA